MQKEIIIVKLNKPRNPVARMMAADHNRFRKQVVTPQKGAGSYNRKAEKGSRKASLSDSYTMRNIAYAV